MPFTPTVETDMFIAPNGSKYILSRPPSRFVMSEEGTGMPPINYVTQRGPYQHGESLRDFFLLPRTVQLIVRHNYCDRQSYWDGRNELMSVLVPNGGPLSTLATGILRKIQPDGTTRDLSCVIDEGPKFTARDTSQWDEFSYTETLRFVAHNPIYFDPVQKTHIFSDDYILFKNVFPILFPISFNATYDIQNIVSYSGNWVEYPVITVVGPMDKFTITNLTTGLKIEVDGLIDTGRTLTIDLTYGRKTVTLDDGTNFIGYVTVDSDLAQFALIPGDNLISVLGFLTGPFAPDNRVTIAYYDRYLGI